MIDNRVTWLVNEVNDLLNVSNVGLYEFLWLLRGRQPTIEETDMSRIASDALNQLLMEKSVKLILLTWANQDSEGDFDISKLSASDWNDPSSDAQYVAVARI